MFFFNFYNIIRVYLPEKLVMNKGKVVREGSSAGRAVRSSLGRLG